MLPTPSTERVVLDASVLLGGRRAELLAAAALHYYAGFWSTWIVGEFVRERTAWIAERAAREGCTRAETRRRPRVSRQRVNALLAALTGVLQSVDYTTALPVAFSWLRDPDDWPVMQPALAARADTLVTHNATDFPLAQERNGVLLLGSADFLAALDRKLPDAEPDLRAYLGGESTTAPGDR